MVKEEMTGLIQTIRYDLRCKAHWCYQSVAWKSCVKALLTDGTMAMVIYRLMQWSRRRGMSPLEMIFNKLNSVFNNCIIGRGAEFGPGFVLIHASGTVINGDVRGGSRIYIEHQVTIGAENRRSPVIENDVFIGAGARVIGNVNVGDGARVGANAVVLEDVPAYCTVAGVPARVVRRRRPASDEAPVAEDQPHGDAIDLVEHPPVLK
jgi:serine O-acetyltransferase